MINLNSNHKKGFTLIEGLILIFIFSIITTTFYQSYTLGLQHIIESKNKLTAIALANEKIETHRSKPYNDIAVQGGTPNGSIDPDENVTVGSQIFHVLTEITYVDDPDDGTEGGSPDDEMPNDYKVVKINVKWGKETAQQSVSLVSRFIPPGTENNIGGGTLSINVIDSGGAPVSGAAVNVYNDTVVPTVNYNGTTDSDGNISMPSTETGDDYRITVSKSDQEYVQTVSMAQTDPYSPATDVDATIIEGDLTTVTVISGVLSDINIQTENPFGVAVSDVDFDLEGGRYLGTDPLGDPYYNYDQSLESDGSGIELIEDVSPGNYTVTLTESGYTLWKNTYSAGTNDRNVIELPQNITLDVDMVVLDNTYASYFLQVTDSVDGNPIEGAQVNLKNDTLPYDETLDTDQYGYVYFPENDSAILTDSESYDVSITATGYNSGSDTVTISNLTEDSITLDPI